MLRMRQPWARLLEQICSRLRIGERVDRLVDAGMGRQHAVIERKCNLGHAGDTGRGLGVTEQGLDRAEIGRASGRERVCQYVSISVVAVSLNTKQVKSNTHTQRKQN